MRRFYRQPLDLASRLALRREELAILGGADPRKRWVTLRSSTAFRPIVESLAAASGVRQRCMYCCDSRSCDVDHFVPLSTDASLAMRWQNFLWVCADCNRRKSARYDPHLINPFEVNPWHHFIFVEDSGEISSRWISATQEDPFASATLSILSTLRHEAVTEGRLRTYRRIRHAAETWLGAPRNGALRESLVAAFRDDEYGVGAWLMLHEGRSAPPWPDVNAADPALSRRLRALSSRI